ncbi:hypothetical protein CASFOL_028227 [Castilleja foliolosa]|uniref:DNA helicase Pif1-like 2B domain-containing protein n=1 Tax=Castilleja foliolosa TaxID=1961234 RepID=A0ABD3CGJ6_9LAMI
MRLQSLGENDETVALSEFAEWIAGIGDGTIGDGENGKFKVEIPNHMLIGNDGDPLASIVDAIYPELDDGPADPSYLKDRAILAPTLALVDSVNHYMIERMSGECRTYYSSNSACSSDSCSDILADVHTPEFLSAIKCSGVPNHELKLKVGAPVMLLRNIDPGMGLCNGTRLLITRLGSHVLEGRIITGTNSGERVIIPRLSLTPSDVKVPFKFQRRQFPVMISYAMTINKSQGQSLSQVGLYLKQSVFSHGQFYVAVSRVTNPRGLKILLFGEEDEEKKHAVNVVYKEIFENL